MDSVRDIQIKNWVLMVALGLAMVVGFLRLESVVSKVDMEAQNRISSICEASIDNRQATRGIYEYIAQPQFVRTPEQAARIQAFIDNAAKNQHLWDAPRGCKEIPPVSPPTVTAQGE